MRPFSKIPKLTNFTHTHTQRDRDRDRERQRERSQARQFRSVIPLLRRLKQDDYEFSASLGYVASSTPAQTT